RCNSRCPTLAKVRWLAAPRLVQALVNSRSAEFQSFHRVANCCQALPHPLRCLSRRRPRVRVPYTPPLQGPGFPSELGKGPWASGFSSDELSLRCNRAPAWEAGGIRLLVPYGSAIMAICLDPPSSRLRQRKAREVASRKPLASSASAVSPPTSSTSPTWPGKDFP